MQEKEEKNKSSSSEETIVISDVAQLRGSLPLAQLRNEEAIFFQLIEDGGVTEVEKFLTANRELDVNCVNYKGETALHIAVKEENEDMVKLLLKRPEIEIKDTILLATETGNVELTRTIMEAIKKEYPEVEMKGCEESPNYSPDITPILLAAQKGDYKMVRMFLERGHRIEEPHSPNCLCPKCKAILRQAGSSQSRIRLNSYNALCNPAYTCQVTDDPILYGFLMDAQLSECALMDKEFRSEYVELGKKVRKFLVSLLSECRNPSEIETLLKLPGGFDVEHERSLFPRLQLAIDYHQKEFVAHSMVQQVLTAHWLGEFRSWPRLPLHWKCLHVLVRILLLPVICFALIIVPEVKFLKKYHSPLNRYLMSLASFLFFLFLIFLLNYLDTGRNKRGPPNTGMEVIVVIYVMGFIWSTARRYWAEGARRFFLVVWNWYDIALESFFVLTFFFWVRSMIDVVSEHIQKKKAMERKFWPSNDSTLLHEGFLAIATVLTFGKLAYYCLQSSRLGPLQVSLGKMAIQIGYFLCLCMLINSSFAIPLTRMYAYYDGMTQTNAKGETRTQLSSFSNIPNSFFTLFWGMLGMSPVESTEVVVENLTTDKKNPVINYHHFTQGIGLTLFATYELMMIIALVNTLIAILSNTFQNIIDNADVEFKFARTKLWVHFFDDSTRIPSPFNLFPTLHSFNSCLKYFWAATHQIPGAAAKWSFRRCCYIEYKDRGAVDEQAYGVLMSSIVQRYFRTKELEE
ncbi:short transient receptor potential channel 3-like [Parasteatoda tepidariorum]|uniref:short transient receptor potential channel 3-like n=1 Tax=Parasteatoda tepidariorum TaxID=114398 RepID=UPI001C722C86|nr:short transient receptor potential channel 3-like [Parasteatoda tepidariorum]